MMGIGAGERKAGVLRLPCCSSVLQGRVHLEFQLDCMVSLNKCKQVVGILFSNNTGSP